MVAQLDVSTNGRAFPDAKETRSRRCERAPRARATNAESGQQLSANICDVGMGSPWLDALDQPATWPAIRRASVPRATVPAHRAQRMLELERKYKTVVRAARARLRGA
eukprot:5060602-Pyramimonas_sp.AAC.1